MSGRATLVAVLLVRGALPALPWRLGLSAVIEEQGPDDTHVKSYWALAHFADKPDFHHPGAFTLELGEIGDSPRLSRL